MNRSGLLVRRAASTLAIGALAFGSALALGTGASAAPGDSVELIVSQDSGLDNGQAVTVTGTGLDPEVGYYLSTCVIGTEGPTGPDCAGGPGIVGASIWVSNNPSANAPINPDGTFTTDLNVTQTGETMNKVAIDCDETPCAVTLFGDHRNGFGYTAGTPVTFGAAPAAAAAPATTAEASDEASDEASSNTVWWIVGGVIVVAAIAGGGAVALRKKS
ncbi:neocarzinostatin apoprotein domain-containing protein [Tomitella biformata]|uniref:neocarzinostatin apoprotein domain-containing protein n=1 Tax=Tomitella biformata TaxID=630403 RepID=UPI000464BE7C|nr:neocarzinostatin apoprotein domain-containing protein [Tomitella biformata]